MNDYLEDILVRMVYHSSGIEGIRYHYHKQYLLYYKETYQEKIKVFENSMKSKIINRLLIIY